MKASPSKVLVSISLLVICLAGVAFGSPVQCGKQQATTRQAVAAPEVKPLEPTSDSVLVRVRDHAGKPIPSVQVVLSWIESRTGKPRLLVKPLTNTPHGEVLVQENLLWPYGELRPKSHQPVMLEFCYGPFVMHRIPLPATPPESRQFDVEIETPAWLHVKCLAKPFLNNKSIINLNVWRDFDDNESDVYFMQESFPLREEELTRIPIPAGRVVSITSFWREGLRSARASKRVEIPPQDPGGIYSMQVDLQLDHFQWLHIPLRLSDGRPLPQGRIFVTRMDRNLNRVGGNGTYRYTPVLREGSTAILRYRSPWSDVSLRLIGQSMAESGGDLIGWCEIPLKNTKDEITQIPTVIMKLREEILLCSGMTKTNNKPADFPHFQVKLDGSGRLNYRGKWIKIPELNSKGVYVGEFSILALAEDFAAWNNGKLELSFSEYGSDFSPLQEFQFAQHGVIIEKK